MVGFLGARGASAVVGLFMLALASSEAGAQNISAAVPAAVRSLEVDGSARPLGSAAPTAVQTISGSAKATSAAVVTASGAVVQAQPARTVTVSLQPDVAREAAWLYRGGWPLYALADRFSAGAALSDQAYCIAVAVYHEARGESVEGQLAVARVIMNRAQSGKYPASWCGVVKQPWQFSFVSPRTGQFPSVDTGSTAWARAQGVTRLAIANVVPTLSSDVLWYHANYVAPSWGRRLNRVSKIGTHIFYSS